MSCNDGTVRTEETTIGASLSITFIFVEGSPPPPPADPSMANVPPSFFMLLAVVSGGLILGRSRMILIANIQFVAETHKHFSLGL